MAYRNIEFYKYKILHYNNKGDRDLCVILRWNDFSFDYEKKICYAESEKGKPLIKCGR